MCSLVRTDAAADGKSNCSFLYLNMTSISLLSVFISFSEFIKSLFFSLWVLLFFSFFYVAARFFFLEVWKWFHCCAHLKQIIFQRQLFCSVTVNALMLGCFTALRAETTSIQSRDDLIRWYQRFWFVSLYFFCSCMKCLNAAQSWSWLVGSMAQ